MVGKIYIFNIKINAPLEYPVQLGYSAAAGAVVVVDSAVVVVVVVAFNVGIFFLFWAP